MRRLIPILLLVGFMAMVMKPIGPYAEYLLNIEFISNNYCVNQDVPQLQCKGKCYLMNRIKAQTENSSSQEVLQIVAAPDFPVLPVSNFTWTPVRDVESMWPALPNHWHEEWAPRPLCPPPQLV